MTVDPSTIGVIIITGLAVAVEVGCAIRRPKKARAAVCCRRGKKAMAAGLLLVAVPASSAPYFRLIDPKHPQIIAGVWTDPTGKDRPYYGSSIALITHSTKDGSLFESVQSDWALLTVGGGYGNGEAFAAIGPSANLAPAVKSFGLTLLDLVDKSGKYPNLRSLLAPPPGGSPDINVAFGPQFMTRPIEGGVVLPLSKWRGRLCFFAGAAWRF
jgi:hypothetical protein